jgi:hypothetical protein
MRWLIDAMNLIGSRPDGWWRDRDAAVEALIGWLERWAADAGEEVTLVLERPAPEGVAATAIAIAHAPELGRDAADHEIVRLLEDDPHPEEARVVTSDRQLADRVRSLGAAVESAGAFRRRLE